MSASAWRDIKRQIIVVRSILISKDISGDDRKKMERSIEDLQSLLETTFPDPGAFKDEIISRRDFLSKNFGLLDVFNTLWFIIHSHVNEDGALSKDGYFKFMYSVYVALCGFHSFDDIRNTLELDYYIDHKIFGPMTKLAFFDMLFEVIETWSEILHKSFLAAFSWALLDSIVDMNASLPRLKYIRDVRCIVQAMSEVDMIAKINSNKKIKGCLAIGNEWMERIPEVQRLLRSKKVVQAFAEKVSNMIDLRQNRNNGQFQGPFEDSDHEQSHGKVDLYLMQSGKAERKVITDGDEDDKSGGSTDNNDDASFNGSVSSQQLTNSRSHKLNTMSFIEYLKGRRHARHQLNGDMPSIPSQSRSGVLSINSLEFDSLPGTAVVPPQQSLLSSSQSHSLQSHLLSKSAFFSDTQTVDTHTSAAATDTMGLLDVVGKNILGKSAAGNSSVGGRKTELPMKNVLLDMATIAHGAAGNSKHTRGPPKQRYFDASSSAVRNGFNAELGMVVKPLTLPGAAVTMGDSFAPTRSEPSSAFHNIQQLSLQGCIAPASEASTALAELTRNRTNILIPTTGFRESEGSLGAHSVVSGLNENDASIRSFVKTPDQAVVAAAASKSSMSARAASPKLIMSDELINSPTELESAFRSDTPDIIDLDSRSIRTDVSGECGPLTMKSDFGVEDLIIVEPINIKSVDGSKFEQPLSPPKLSSPEQSRHILGPFPSAYFLSSGNTFNTAATAANNRVGALPTSFLAGFPQPITTATTGSKSQHRGDSTADSSNQVKDVSKAPPTVTATTTTDSTTSVQQEKAHDYIINAYPLSTNSRGIFKGLASISSADREWNNKSDKPSSAAIISQQQQQQKQQQQKQQQRFTNTESSSSLPNAPMNKASRSSEGSQSIPSLLIRPVTAIQRAPSTIFLRKDRMDQDRAASQAAAAAESGFKSDGGGGGGGAVVVSAGVINDSVKSLTMLSNSQFEHFKNSIEVSVGGGHLHTYGANNNSSSSSSSSSSAAKNGSSTISPVKRPQLSLQQVGPSPVRYECHQSFLSISGSKDSNFTTTTTTNGVTADTHKNFQSRPFMGNAPSVFSNAASNALNTVQSDHYSGDTATRLAVIVENGKYDVPYNETVLASIATPFHLKQDFPHAPWVPQELLIPLDHNRSNRILGWREKLESLKSIPHIPAKVTMTIKSQDAVRVSFEEFVKRRNGKYK